MSSKTNEEMMVESIVATIVEETVRYTATRLLNVFSTGRKTPYDRHISLNVGPEGFIMFIRMLTDGYLDNDKDFKSFLDCEMEFATDFLTGKSKDEK